MCGRDEKKDPLLCGTSWQFMKLKQDVIHFSNNKKEKNNITNGNRCHGEHSMNGNVHIRIRCLTQIQSQWEYPRGARSFMVLNHGNKNHMWKKHLQYPNDISTWKGRDPSDTPLSVKWPLLPSSPNLGSLSDMSYQFYPNLFFNGKGNIQKLCVIFLVQAP